MADRRNTPSQLSLFGRSPVIGVWWEEFRAHGLFKGERPPTNKLDELLFEQGKQHQEVLLEWLELKA